MEKFEGIEKEYKIRLTRIKEYKGGRIEMDFSGTRLQDYEIDRLENDIRMLLPFVPALMIKVCEEKQEKPAQDFLPYEMECPPPPEEDAYFDEEAYIPETPVEFMAENEEERAGEQDRSKEAHLQAPQEDQAPERGEPEEDWQARKEREIFEKLKKEDAARERKAAQSSGEESSGTGEVYTHREGQVVLGRPIQKEPSEMRDLDMFSESPIPEAVVRGEVLSVEQVDISDKSFLYRFDITDRTNSITCKRFVRKNEKELDRVSQLVKPGAYFTVRGKIMYDDFDRQKLMNVSDMVCAPIPKHEDRAETKRVELHMHTQYSAMDAVNKVKDMMARAHEFGHDAVGITDHGVLQAYPEVQVLAKKYGIKALYGVEGYLVDSGRPIVTFGKDQPDGPLDQEVVFFDLETTGLSRKKDKIIEIAAVRVRNGQIIDNFTTLVNPHRKLPAKIVELTGITDQDLEGKPEEADAIQSFYDYVGDSLLAAHNASFDIGFLSERLRKERDPVSFPITYIDTLPMAQTLIPEIKSYKLSRLCSYFKIKNEHAHRALDDSVASAKVLVELMKIAKARGAEKLSDLDKMKDPKILAEKQARPWHVIIYAKNQKGLRDLYELVSISHLEYFHKKPRIPRSELVRFRENLIIGSACCAGELYQSILDEKEESEIEKTASFYDFLEVQPIGNNMFMTRDSRNPMTVRDLENHNKKIIALGRKLGKPVVATGDVHFLNKEDSIFRAVLTSTMHSDAELQPPLYYRNTEEMLEEFSYLPKETAYEIVVENTRKIADMIEEVKPVPDGTYPPVIEGAEDDIRNMCEKRAHEIYGEDLPDIVAERMNKELDSIISNGYAVLYLIAQKLVENSENAGYLVGSRGSVGSSFAAMLSGITEVNSLPPHYVCPKCKHSEFFEGLSIVGPDLEDKDCPVCGAHMNKDGYDIPFETFLGFNGDKEPDIDLNFSGDNQADAHAYTEVLFGKGKTFRAGTISTLAEKTAYGYVKNYFQEKGEVATNAEVERLKNGCSGVKKTTGQHPGGIMVVPKDQDIYNFTPVQRPADDPDSDTITTHFDYHSISGRLLKLDILGHDDPTMLRILYENTGVNPRDIPLDDREVLSLFAGTEALNFKEEVDLDLGTAGVPEFGTPFTKQMVRDAKPKTLADLIRISGLSHGTDVWTNNAQVLVNSGQVGIGDVISTRDDIMLGLINFGLPPINAFSTMEHVRKGKGLTEEEEALMREKNVPEWYIDSCKKIKYMFPKAHAVAYVVMAYRIAWYKIHYPEQYYAAYFGIRAKEFDLKVIQGGLESVKAEMERLNKKSRVEKLSNKEQNSQVSLELALEMYARGISCRSIDLNRSHYRFFIPEKGYIIPPFTAVAGLGSAVAEKIVSEREKRPFISQDDLQERSKINNSCLEALNDLGCLRDLPKSDQISFFNFGA